jgi:hypothetical protein
MVVKAAAPVLRRAKQAQERSTTIFERVYLVEMEEMQQGKERHKEFWWVYTYQQRSDLFSMMSLFPSISSLPYLFLR